MKCLAIPHTEELELEPGTASDLFPQAFHPGLSQERSTATWLPHDGCPWALGPASLRPSGPAVSGGNSRTVCTVCGEASWKGFQLFSIPSGRRVVLGPTSFRGAPSHSPSSSRSSTPHSRATAATTSCPLKRKSVCSSWRRPSAHWTLRLTAGCPRTSLSKTQLPEPPERRPQPSLPPRVREARLGERL